MKFKILKMASSLLGVNLLLSLAIPVFAYDPVPSGTEQNETVSAENGDIEQKPAKQGSPMIFRFYNKQTGAHFYTCDDAEINQLRLNMPENFWVDEGLAWYASPTGDPVFRLYNQHSGEHFYTASENERAALIKAGWKSEGVAFCSNTPDKSPVYRLYNPNAGSQGSHFFTLSKSEADALVKAGWKSEGIAWYATDHAEFFVGAGNHLFEGNINDLNSSAKN